MFCSLAMLVAVLTISCHNKMSKENTQEQSSFVGSWDWEENNPENHSFYVWIGERNDSLLFEIGGVFYGGQKIHMPDYDEEGNMIAVVKTKTPKGNIVKSKICETLSRH